MKSKRTFNPGAAVADARAGKLKGPELRKAIAIATEFGNAEVAAELKTYLISAMSFAGDAAPEEMRVRVAKGVSALVDMGHRSTRTQQMLKKHGVIETLNGIAKHADSSVNFERLRSADLLHLTAEAIVLDFPALFSEQAIALARERLGADWPR